MARLTQKSFPKGSLITVIILLVLVSSTANAGSRHTQMRVSCFVLPAISLQLNSDKPVYGDFAATVVAEPGQVQLTSTTNDPKASDFILIASSERPLIINGVRVVPSEEVELGHYSYGTVITLNVTGNGPVRFTAVR